MKSIWLGKDEITRAFKQMGETPVEFKIEGDKLIVPMVVGEANFTVSIERKREVDAPELAKKRRSKCRTNARG